MMTSGAPSAVKIRMAAKKATLTSMMLLVVVDEDSRTNRFEEGRELWLEAWSSMVVTRVEEARRERAGRGEDFGRWMMRPQLPTTRHPISLPREAPSPLPGWRPENEGRCRDWKEVFLVEGDISKVGTANHQSQ
jgi:hypothetical protein